MLGNVDEVLICRPYVRIWALVVGRLSIMKIILHIYISKHEYKWLHVMRNILYVFSSKGEDKLFSVIQTILYGNNLCHSCWFYIFMLPFLVLILHWYEFGWFYRLPCIWFDILEYIFLSLYDI